MNTRTATAVAALAILQAGAFASLDDDDALLFEAGTLLVANGDVVSAFDPAGVALPAPITGVQSAVDVCFAPDGTLLVSDDVAEAVYVRGAQGQYIACLSAGASLLDPAGLALGPGGELWVASRGTDTLAVFDADGQHVRDAGADAGLDEPWGLAFDAGGRLHVADSGDDEVVVLDVSGAWLGALDAPALDDPRGLCFGRDGRLYVASHAGDGIVVFDAQGELLGTWKAGNQLDGPVGVAFGPDGNLYVTLPALGQVAVLDAQGQWVATLDHPGLQDCAGLAFAPQFADASLKATLQRPGEARSKLKGAGRLGLFPGALPVTLALDDAGGELGQFLGRVSVFHGAAIDAAPTARDSFGLQAGPAAAQLGLSALRLDLKGTLAPGAAGSDAWRAKKASGALHAATPAGVLDADIKSGKLRP